MTSATIIAILAACAALLPAGCASKRVLPDSSSVPANELSASTEKSSEDGHRGQKESKVEPYEEEEPYHQPPSEPPPIEEQVRMAKDMIKRKGEYFPEVIASEDHDTLLSIEALFWAMRGLIDDPKRWFPQLGFSARDQVLFLGTTRGSFLWVVATSDEVSIGSRVFRKPATVALYKTLIEAISRVCNTYAGESLPDGVLGSQRAAPDHQLATTIDFSCGPITLELYGVRGSNKYTLDLIRSSDSPLRKSTSEQPPK